MGINYYLYQPTCPHCGRGDEPLHIGKSSAAWCFALHVMPSLGINSLEDWQAKWATAGVTIRDEYGTLITPDKMLNIIIHRAGPVPGPPPGWYERNRAEPGPFGLARHRPDHESGCVGHGPGTWDLLEGDFA